MTVQREAALLQAGLRAGLYDEAELARLRPLARARQSLLSELLCRERRFPPSALYRALAQARGLPYRPARELAVDEAVLRKLPHGLVARCRVVPARPSAVTSPQTWPHTSPQTSTQTSPQMSPQTLPPTSAAPPPQTSALPSPLHDSDLLFVTDHPDDVASLDLVRRATSLPGSVVVSDPSSIDALLSTSPGTATAREASAPEGADDAVQMFDRIMKDAWLHRASDVHFEPVDDMLRVRFRVDGQMAECGQPIPLVLARNLVSRIKVLARMDIGEQRAAQDGSFSYTLAGWDKPALELRAASMPVMDGERVALRLLGDQTRNMTLAGLGMPPAMLEDLRRALSHSHGMLVVTGPTGSGKSTTLYAALRELDAARLNVLTIEDPVEQRMTGVNQTSVSQKVGFADALRAFLRHDPDVILVGEIRDRDTADAAIKAAMTGHMVLTTLHTNHAPGAVSRLLDIGCERFLIASTVLGVFAQRLVRRLCPACSTSGEAPPADAALLGAQEGEAPPRVGRPQGCAACDGSGYAGRVALFEAFWIDPATAVRIQTGASEQELIGAARRYYRLADDARAKVAAGLTSVDEVRAILMPEH